MPPGSTQSVFALAQRYHREGRLAEAEALYGQILTVEPRHVEALHLSGVLYHQLGRHSDAAERIRQALLLDPGNAIAHANLGEVYRTVGQLDKAIASLRQAIQIDPDDAPAHYNLANALRDYGRLGEATVEFRHALRLEPGYAEAHNNLGNVLRMSGQVMEAIAEYRDALALQPDYVEAHNNLGNALAEEWQLTAAIASFRRALEFRPNYHEAWNNLGNALMNQGEWREAEASFRRALALKPDFSEAKFNYSMLLLLGGDFEQGWPLYEARPGLSSAATAAFSHSRWDGGPVNGKRLLVHAEQGFGDSIQFIRYAAPIAARGGQVILVCPRSLVELLRSAKGVHEVVAAGDRLPPFDLHVPMLSLPLIFRTTRESIPGETPYLVADPARRETWVKQLSLDRTQLRIGLAWAGNSRHGRSRIRDIAIESLLPLLSVEGIEIHSLQFGERTGDVQRLPASPTVLDHTNHIKDFADTAALMMELDLIISVDTAAAHLAGALGKPVWTLLPFVPDWRWGLEGETTPWYPTMRLFRQPSLGDWESVIERIAGELQRLVESRG